MDNGEWRIGVRIYLPRTPILHHSIGFVYNVGTTWARAISFSAQRLALGYSSSETL